MDVMSGDWYEEPYAAVPGSDELYELGFGRAVTALVNWAGQVGCAPLGSALFPTPTILVTEYNTDSIATYAADGNGNLGVNQPQLLLSDEAQPEGLAFDPRTGDALITSFA